MGLLGFDSMKSSASQTTQTASGEGKIISGKSAQVGTLNVGAKGTYTEAGAINLSGSKNTSFTINTQSVDREIVSDALQLVSDLQTQSTEQAKENAAAFKAANANLTSLLTSAPVEIEGLDASAVRQWLKWLGLGALVLTGLYLLFRRT